MQSAKTFSNLRLVRPATKPWLWPAPARAKLEFWVNRHGCNSTSYVLLEGPKRYFTSPHVDGFLAYQVRAGVAVIGGDPVCTRRQAPELIRNFVAAMTTYPVGAYQVSFDMRDAFREAGFKDIQIGKEAIFDLSRFSIAGGLMELVRAATNKARREGVVVSEHRPFALGARSVNDELRSISAEWLKEKGEHEFGFLLGSLDLEHRSAKRYFVARSGGRVLQLFARADEEEHRHRLREQSDDDGRESEQSVLRRVHGRSKEAHDDRGDETRHRHERAEE